MEQSTYPKIPFPETPAQDARYVSYGKQRTTEDLIHGVHLEAMVRMQPSRHEIPLDKDPNRPQFTVDIPSGGVGVKLSALAEVGSVRGGADGIGFLNDDCRQNVAVTRAKRHLAVICDSETVSQSKFIAMLISWMEENGEQIGLGYRSEGTRGHDRRMILKKERIISDPGGSG